MATPGQSAQLTGHGVKVLLADDDPHVRSAVRLLLQDEPGIAILEDCTNAECLIERTLRSSPDVLLVDWDLPGLRRSVLDQLRSGTPACRVVALSGRPEHRAEALRAGAVGFVSKVDAPESLLTVLRGLQPR